MNVYDEEADAPETVAHLTHEEYTEYKATCQALLDLAKQAEKLSKNPDFKAIVMDAYFTEEPKRLAGLMATGRITDKVFNDCTNDLKAIGSMRSFLQDFIAKGNIAADELKNLEVAWNEAVTADAIEAGESS